MERRLKPIKRNKIISLICFVCAVCLGLLLPLLTAAGQDAAFRSKTWPLNESNAHYDYQGTLMNRVLALNAHLTGSPAILSGEAETSVICEDSIPALSAFLPVENAVFKNASAYTLSPRQYRAQYRYLNAFYEIPEGTLSIISDGETGLPLRIELNCAPDTLQEYLLEHDLWDILRSYAALLNLGQPTDDETTISTVIKSQSAQLRGTAYKLTVTVIPSAGSLLLKLSASTPA